MAAIKGYFALKEECHHLQTTIDAIYPSLTFAEPSVLQSLNQEYPYSKEFMPSDLAEELIPLKCLGDGNCLFRYMDTLVVYTHSCSCW